MDQYPLSLSGGHPEIGLDSDFCFQKKIGGFSSRKVGVVRPCEPFLHNACGTFARVVLNEMRILQFRKSLEKKFLHCVFTDWSSC